ITSANLLVLDRDPERLALGPCERRQQRAVNKVRVRSESSIVGPRPGVPHVEITRGQPAFSPNNHGFLQDGLEFPDVPEPWKLLQDRDGVMGDSVDRKTVSRISSDPEVLDQQRNVVAAGARPRPGDSAPRPR